MQADVQFAIPANISLEIYCFGSYAHLTYTDPHV